MAYGSKIIYLMRALIALLMCCSIVGCGGGSEGTGGGTLIRGYIADANGQAISGVRITITATGEDGISDEAGSYSINSTSVLEGNVELAVSGPNANGTIVIPVPIGASEVAISLVLQPDGSITLHSIETPTPTPTPVNRDPALDQGGDSSDCRSQSGTRVCRPNVPTPTATPVRRPFAGGGGQEEATPTPTPEPTATSGGRNPNRDR
ncbi:MAG: hypothetical protein K1X79_08810 [Oligoflexia bacterium]|nr:hypothetical protein [Oligoflexia bacterium]